MNFLRDLIHVPINTETINCVQLEKKSGKNMYETICILEKISQKINNDIKEDMYSRLEEFNFINRNNLFENKEQIEISRFYEKLPKATSISIQYLLDEKVRT